MILIRSLIYQVWIYGALALIGIVYFPFALASKKAAFAAMRAWCGLALLGLRVICGLKIEYRGREFLPGGEKGPLSPVLIAGKHQSQLDTIAPIVLLKRPALVFKRELLSMPIYGWYAKREGQIPVDRDAHASALKAMMKAARERASEGRDIVIFPEGTRSLPGDPPNYKPGIAALYRDLSVACVPMALNSGLFWPAKGIIRRPGTVILQFLEPIPPGLKRDAFMDLLETRIEAATASLIEEARTSGPLTPG